MSIRKTTRKADPISFFSFFCAAVITATFRTLDHPWLSSRSNLFDYRWIFLFFFFMQTSQVLLLLLRVHPNMPNACALWILQWYFDFGKWAAGPQQMHAWLTESPPQKMHTISRAVERWDNRLNHWFMRFRRWKYMCYWIINKIINECLRYMMSFKHSI
jgi:hypothetical protein